MFVCPRVGGHGGAGRGWADIEEVPDVSRLESGGGVVTVERVVGLLVAASVVGLLVLVVKFPDRF